MGMLRGSHWAHYFYYDNICAQHIRLQAHVDPMQMYEGQEADVFFFKGGSDAWTSSTHLANLPRTHN